MDKPGVGRVMVSLGAKGVVERAGIEPVLWPWNAGSYPGYVFTNPSLTLASGHFGLGHGSGAHAPDEHYVIDSANLAVKGYDESVMSFVDVCVVPSKRRLHRPAPRYVERLRAARWEADRGDRRSPGRSLSPPIGSTVGRRGDAPIVPGGPGP